MNSEAMIPSIMAQMNDAMIPILMTIIAATSLKREMKNAAVEGKGRRKKKKR